MQDQKIIVTKQEFQKKVVEAVEILANPVKSTLGPDGIPILLERFGMMPLTTKDGVTVAASINVKDPVLNTIIQAIKEASLNTNSVAGDGTTTAILLTEAIIKESQPYLQTGAITPQRLGDAITKFSNKIIDKLKEKAIPVNDNYEKILQVADISCNGDKEISSVVTDAIDTVGSDGVVVVEESALNGPTSLTVKEGFAIARGYGSLGQLGHCLVNNKVTQTVEYIQPAIVLYNSNVENINDMVNMVSGITCNAQYDIPIVIMAHEFSPPIIKFVFENVMQGTCKILPVKIPKLGAKYSQGDVLEDIAVLTGATVLQPGINQLSDINTKESEFLGSAEKIIATRKETVIYNGKGDEQEIKTRSDQLRYQIDECNNEYEKDILKERLGRLTGGIAIIEVGSTTDLELREKKDRIEDALNAVRAALSDGVLPGGGTALMTAYWDMLHTLKIENNDDRIANEIMSKVVESSIRQITKNAGKKSASILIEEINKRYVIGKTMSGYNARTNMVVDDMFQEGVIDPCKVVVSALQNATSIATTLLRSGGSIVFEKHKGVDPFTNMPVDSEE